MSHPPEHIPDMEHIDDKPKPVKELKKKEDKLKDKVNEDKYIYNLVKGLFLLFCFILFSGARCSCVFCRYKLYS
jgi:hypothetical protein